MPDGKTHFTRHPKKSVQSVEDLLAQLSGLRENKFRSGTWFRGASKQCWQPLPTIGCPRPCPQGKRTLNWIDERNILHRFRRRVYQHLGRVLNSWEALFLARHYLLPARILDWTANPLVALWFACSADPGEPAAVWCITRTKYEEHDLDVVDLALRPEAETEGYGPLEIYTEYRIDDYAVDHIKNAIGRRDWVDSLKTLKDSRKGSHWNGGPEFFEEIKKVLPPHVLAAHRPVLLRAARAQYDKPTELKERTKPSEYDAIKILHPFYNSPRMIAQAGAFTLHSNPWIELPKYADHPFFVERLDIDGLFEWQIQPEYKAPILKELAHIGIARPTLYPDLDGLSQGLVEDIMLRDEGETSNI